MEQTNIIKSCTFKSEWAGPNGVIYYHNITFDNGDTGTIGTKEKMPDKLSPGSELTYTIEVNERGNKIKAVAPKPKFGGGRPGEPIELKMATFALSYSKDLVIGGKLESKDMFAIADKMFDWIKAKI